MLYCSAWPLANISHRTAHVRFRGSSGHGCLHLTLADIVRLPRPVNARCIASGGSKMDVQVVCSHVCELTLYCRFDVSPFDDFPARHHSRGIKAAPGEGAFAKLLRDLPDSIEGFLTAANVDGQPHCSRSQGESFSKTWRAPLRSSETRDGLLLCRKGWTTARSFAEATR